MNFFRPSFFVSAAVIKLVFVSPVSSCIDQVCRLGYQFCEQEKGVCRNCEDYKDFCFVDNKHISNCSSFCKGIENNLSTAIYDQTDGALLIAVCILAFLLFCAISIIIILAVMYCKRRLQKLSTDAEGSTFSSSTTVSYSDKTDSTKEDVASEDQLLLSSTDMPPDFRQVPVTNDRGDEPKLMVSGKRIPQYWQSEAHRKDTSVKCSMDA